jgi:methyl-accepting chemotaxis protein
MIYSHRIAGPLYRIKLSARAIAEGRLDTTIKLRQKDAVSSFADSLNEMTKAYRDRTLVLTSDMQHLQNSILTIKALPEKDEKFDSVKKEILLADRRIRHIMNSLTL